MCRRGLPGVADSALLTVARSICSGSGGSFDRVFPTANTTGLLKFMAGGGNQSTHNRLLLLLLVVVVLVLAPLVLDCSCIGVAGGCSCCCLCRPAFSDQHKDDH